MEILEKISGIIKNYGNGGKFLKFINMVKSSYGVLALFGYGKNKDGDVIPSIEKKEKEAFDSDDELKSALSRRGIDPSNLLGSDSINNQSLINMISSIMKNIQMGKDFYAFIDDFANDRDLYREKRHRVCNQIYKYHDANSCERIVKLSGLSLE